VSFLKRRADLIDQFTELVAGPDDPRQLAERTIDVVMTLVSGRSGALFTLPASQLTLLGSRGIDQHVLTLAHEVWTDHRALLEGGETFYCADRESDRRLARAETRGGPAAFVIVPVLDDERIVALLYVDSLEPHFCAAHDLERLTRFRRILLKAVGQDAVAAPPSAGPGWEAYLERTPVGDMEREKLLLLLNRNEWNIARVARLMGVTRRTVYLRLQRYNIPRERVPKGRPARPRA
jgi:hypothetical protein